MGSVWTRSIIRLLIALTLVSAHAAAQPPPQLAAPQRLPVPDTSGPTAGTGRSQRSVIVPSIIGANRAEAQRRLIAALLIPQTDRESSTDPDATVVRQSPEAGRTVPAGTSVVLMFAAARVLVPVPSIIGMDLPTARRRLSEAQLLLQSDQRRTPDTGAKVVEQSPQAGQRVPVRSGVVAKLETPPPQLILVPSIIGTTEAEAERRLTGSRLLLQIERPLPVPAGATVVRQDPRPGTRVAPGTRITAAFVPAPPQLIPVPSIVGDDLARAQRRLSAAQLVLQPERPASSSADARVVRQSPQAGQQVQAGTPVVAVFEVPEPQTVSVPSIIGTSADEAERRLVAAHLVLCRDKPAPSTPSGKVVRQNPQPGEQVPPGTPIVATFEGPAPALVSVPSLIGMTQMEARPHVSVVALTLQIDQRTPPSSEAKIVQQTPTAGERVAPGTQVLATFEIPPPQPVTRPTGNWTQTTWMAGAFVLIALAALAGLSRWVRRMRKPRSDFPPHVLHVHARKDPGRPSIQSRCDPAGPAFGVRVTRRPGVFALIERDSN